MTNLPHEAARLALLRRCGILDTVPESDFDQLAAMAAAIAGMPIALVSLVDERRSWFKARHGVDLHELPRAGGFCDWAITNPAQPLVIADVRCDQRWTDHPSARAPQGDEPPPFVAYVGIPLCIGAERMALGTLCVLDRQPRTVSPEGIDQLRVLARQVEVLIELRLHQVQMANARSEIGQDQEQLLLKVAAQVPGVVFQYLLRPDGSAAFPYSSAGIQDIYGVTPAMAAISAQPVFDRIHPQDLSRVTASIHESARLGTLWICNYRYLHPDGSTRWLQGRALPEPSIDGAILWHGFIADIGELKALEERQRQSVQIAEAALRESDALFSTLNAHALVSITDRTGTITEVNEQFCRISGYRRDELIGANHRLLNSGTQGREFWLAMWQTIAEGRSWRADVCNQAKDGSLYWVDSVIAPFMDGEGRIQKIVSIRNDITVSRRHHHELLQAKESAEAGMRAKAEFLATMSHEIRTPMNGVIGMTNFLLQTALDPQQQEFAETIRSCSESLLTLINDILDVSKLEAGRVELEHIPFSLAQVVEEVVLLFTAQAETNGIELIYFTPANLPAQFIGDPMRVRQVLLNLVSNALKFTLKGSVTIRIVPLSSDAGILHLRIEVQDTGVGMTPEQIARLGQAFTQADSSTTRRFGGSGLGITISTALLKLMHTALEVESQPGSGSIFRFSLTLPIVTGELPVLRGSVIADCPAIAAIQLQRVLIVDDIGINQRIMALLLKRFAAHIATATNGSEAVAAMKATPFDCVFMDCQMPVMDGYQATAAIRAHEQAHGLPRQLVIALTAHAMVGDREACLAAGMDDYLSKPLRENDLVGLLGRYFGTAHQFSVPQLPVPPHSAPRWLSELRAQMPENELSLIAEALLVDYPRMLAEAQAAEASGDHKRLARVAHSLKGSAAGLRFHELMLAISDLEAQAKSGTATSLTPAVNRLQREIDLVVTAFRSIKTC